MIIELTLEKEERKRMVQVISELTRSKPEYQGVSSCAYQVDEFLVGKTGTLEFSDDIDSGLLEKVMEGLDEAGFDVLVAYKETKEDSGQAETYALNISVPADKVDLEKLDSLLEAKGELIKMAIGTDRLDVIRKEDKVTFPWFKDLTMEEMQAYTRFISALCEMTIKQKRITAKPRENENPKYSFRCFLLRLGFIGDEYKADRKILLSKLDGSSAFKSGKRGGKEE